MVKTSKVAQMLGPEAVPPAAGVDMVPTESDKSSSTKKKKGRGWGKFGRRESDAPPK